jgi:tetratricopeptide (TPR) repeat protein
VFTEGEAMARQAGDLRSRAMLLNGFGVLRSHVGDADDWVECTLEAAGLAQQTGDEGLRLAIRTRLVIALIAAGDLRRALALCDEAMVESAADPRLGAEILGYSPLVRLMNQRGKLLIDVGRLEEGVHDLERAGQLARAEGDVELLGFTHGEYVTLARIRGDAEAALVHARETMRIAEKLGSPFFRAGAHLSFGQAHILAARWPEARAALEEAITIARAGAAFAEAEPLALAWLAGAHLGAGDTDAALAAADEGLAVAQRRRTRVAECIAHIGRARVLLRTAGAGAGEAVQASLTRALALVDETGARSNEPFVRVQRARLAGLLGDQETWRRELTAAHQLFAGMGATPRASKLSAELG